MSPLRYPRFILVGLSLLAVVSCGPSGDAVARLRVKTDFTALREALLAGHARQVTVYLPQDVGDYLRAINAGTSSSDTLAASRRAPGVTRLLEAVLQEKVPPNVRAHLDLQVLLQRLGDRGLLDCREIRDVSLGRVDVDKDRASAELYYQGNLLPLRVPFVKHASVWELDLLSMLPYAEVLMRLDRAVTGKSESQQVAQIVSPLPLL